MDAHEEMYYASSSSSSRIVEADEDETDYSLYDQALRSRPQQDYYGGSRAELVEGYGDWFEKYYSRNHWGIAVGIFCIGLFQFYGTYYRSPTARTETCCSGLV